MFRCEIYRVVGNTLVPARLVAPGDELIAAVGMEGGNRPGIGDELTVELWRGDRLRDQHHLSRSALYAGGGLALFRLRRNETASGSARLTVRVRMSGREVAHAAVLVDLPRFDAQGRLPDGTERAISQQTQVMYRELLEDELKAAISPESEQDGRSGA